MIQRTCLALGWRLLTAYRIKRMIDASISIEAPINPPHMSLVGFILLSDSMNLLFQEDRQSQLWQRETYPSIKEGSCCCSVFTLITNVGPLSRIHESSQLRSTTRTCAVVVETYIYEYAWSQYTRKLSARPPCLSVTHMPRRLTYYYLLTCGSSKALAISQSSGLTPTVTCSLPCCWMALATWA